MNTTTTIEHPVSVPPVPPVPSIFDRFPRIATQQQHSLLPRNIALVSSLIAAPVIASLLGGRSVRRGLIVGGIAALALGALRWQMARWFTAEPAFASEGSIGKLELRRYQVRVDARAVLDAKDIETALELGFDRLACFLFGANSENETLAMTAPVIASMHDGRYEVSFVMPPDRTASSLPSPEDHRVELREVPEMRLAVMRFAGLHSKENIEWRERELLKELVSAGLSAKGSVMFAGYDAPWTLPQLRRNELWIEIA